MGKITLNGKAHELPREQPLLELLDELNIDRRMIAVALNGDVVPRDTYEGINLRDGDTVEIVRMVGGG
jgi:sulfur carrier protein